MKDLSRIIFGSIAGSLLGAGGFFAIDAFHTDHEDAETICRKDYAGERVCTTDSGALSWRNEHETGLQDGQNSQRQLPHQATGLRILSGKKSQKPC